MSKRSGSGFVSIGIILVLMGYLLQSKIIEWLLDFIGVGLIVLGIVLGIAGLMTMLSTGGGSEEK